MTLQLYNTLARAKQPFEPLIPGHVRMYVCGPTVYDFAHIGNARPVVVFDVLFRLLRHVYGDKAVTYARNITDVEDKIIVRAAENGESIDDLTARTTVAFHQDMAALGALEPTIEPRATDHIPRMIDMIDRLIDEDYAYAAEGHVLFHVPAMHDYGELSRRSRDDQVSGARVEVAPYKKDPADFVLWKPSSDDQPGWQSPWGRGRPGWHIECSAMSSQHLGETFDIHGGGLDLIFPHHENEIAQSRCAQNTPFMARFWMHNGYVVVNGEKMSKSLGNFFTVRQLLEEGFPGEAIRLALLSGHYRQPLDVTREKITEAKAQLDRLYGALRRAKNLQRAEDTISHGVAAALSDDLNTPEALARLHALAHELNTQGDPEQAALTKAALLDSGYLLGLLQQDPEDWFQAESRIVKVGIAKEREQALPITAVKGPSREEIETLIAARKAARQAKDFAEADRIRDALAEQGVLLEDGPQGTTWRRK